MSFSRKSFFKTSMVGMTLGSLVTLSLWSCKNRDFNTEGVVLEQQKIHDSQELLDTVPAPVGTPFPGSVGQSPLEYDTCVDEGGGLSKRIHRWQIAGKKRYCWPTREEVNTWEGLGKSVTDYSNLVGTCLKRPPKNYGEVCWVNSRRERWGRVSQAGRTGGVIPMCKQFISEFIETTYVRGGEFCQWGNCGEGGYAFMCLAIHAGHPQDHVVNCSSKNDHNFTMVWKNETEKYCVLDRWDIIGKGNFFCGAEVKDNRLVVNNVPTTAEWYQKVTCFQASNYR